MHRAVALSTLLAVGICASPRRAVGVHVVALEPAANSGSSSPRWRDIANNPYAASFRGGFSYADSTATVTYEEQGSTFVASFVADGLKPNFAYQLKFTASHGNPAMERLGYMGRWWWEGGPLNVADWQYEADKSNPDISSFLVFGYAVSDPDGHLEKSIAIDSTYHVLWRYGITGVPGVMMPGPNDGYSIDTLVDPTVEPGGAYDVDYGADLVSVFGEHEHTGGNVRPLPDQLVMPPGDYALQFLVTEESFHGSGGLDGWWFHALASPADQMVTFTVVSEVIPEPCTLALFVLGLAAIPVRRTRM